MPNDGFVQFDWEKQRFGFLETLRRVLTLTAVDSDGKERAAAIRYLWQPPMLEENFAKSVLSFKRNIIFQRISFTIHESKPLSIICNTQTISAGYDCFQPHGQYAVQTARKS
jgi:hypothetical protein